MLKRMLFLGLLGVVADCAVAGRVGRDLLALYDFKFKSGAIVADRSGVGSPLNLRISNLRAVRRAAGWLEIRGETTIRSDKPATKIVKGVQKNGAITIEAWIKTSSVKQSGPARIVTLSKNANERNFTLGQDADRFEVRFRTKKTSNNGIPATASPRKKVVPKLTHVVYTRARSGQARIFINGRSVAQKNVPDHLRQWDSQYHLALGNEVSGGRLWKGTYHLVSLYSRDLSSREVLQNFRAGVSGTTETVSVATKELTAGEKLFENKIAALISEHCLECHDTATRKGKVDLSRKSTALMKDLIVPGNLKKSLVWELVESDEMPAKRPALSPEEKLLLKSWIAGGAQWTGELIDPANYSHSSNAKQLWVQRLTIPEYIETVRAATGIDISKEARELLPPDLRADGFSNTAYSLNVDLKHVGAYAKLAGIIIEKMNIQQFTRRFSRSKLLVDKDNRALIENMGKWLLRGPLKEHEIVAYRGIVTTIMASGTSSFEETMGFVIEAMLQSPRFIYRIESQRGDGAIYPANDFELASRLSYIIWGGPPDQELLKVADESSLGDPQIFSSQVTRMLRDKRATTRSQQFISEWLNLGRLANMRPSPKKFPNWTSELGEDMRQETLAFFKDIVWDQKRPLAELLNAKSTYVTPRLAKHYGMNYQGVSLGKIDLSKSKSRGGLLTQGSVLTIGGDEASMVTRGLFVMHDLLRGVVKDPPPGVSANPPATKPGLTHRGVAEERIADRNCGGCHIKFEPLAFGLEKYDGIGAFHEKDEHGNKLREDGEILFPGTAKPVAYQTSSQLMDLLASSDRVKESLTWKLAQFAMGRPLTSADIRVVDNIHRAAQKNGGTYTSLITAIVNSDLVQMTRTEIAKK